MSSQSAELVQRLENLPERSEDWIVTQYALLLTQLASDPIGDGRESRALRCVRMAQRFPELAESYNQLFTMACTRSTPIPVHDFKEIVSFVHQARRGEISDHKARCATMVLGCGRLDKK